MPLTEDDSQCYNFMDQREKTIGLCTQMEAFHPLALLAIERKLTYLTAEKLSFLIEKLSWVDRQLIPGNVVECGIGLGGSSICIASHLSPGRRFYGFDNFELIPPPGPLDGERPNSRYEVIKSGLSEGIGGDPYYGYEPDRWKIVKRNFTEFGLSVDDQRIFLVKGLFDRTMPEVLKSPIAFAHIDCDWYEPVMFCLQTIYPFLSIGGAIVIDDYNHWDGCTKATDEFHSDHKDLTLSRFPTSAMLVRLPS